MNTTEWQAAARALRWPEADIAGLQTVLRMQPPHVPGDSVDEVVKVETSVITIARVARTQFVGTGGDGVAHVHPVVARGVWRWRRTEEAGSVRVRLLWTVRWATRPPRALPPLQTAPAWCPAHAYGCTPDEHGCGAIRVATQEVCRCYRRFYRGKEYVEHDRECVLREPAPPRPTEPTVTIVLEPTRVSAPRVGRGKALPGQLGLLR